MGIFSRLYQWVIGLSGHRRAPHYLAGLSFAESSFFPIPPDALLIPMVIAKPQRAAFLAGMTTLFSVLGGLAGYLIGYLAFEAVGMSIIEGLQLEGHYQSLLTWFSQWGIWVVLVAGFTPIPYKLFTLTAGMLSMNIVFFTLASLLGRGGRFFLVAFLLKKSHNQIDRWVVPFLDKIGWGCVVLVILAYFLLQGWA